MLKISSKNVGKIEERTNTGPILIGPFLLNLWHSQGSFIRASAQGRGVCQKWADEGGIFIYLLKILSPNLENFTCSFFTYILSFSVVFDFLKSFQKFKSYFSRNLSLLIVILYLSVLIQYQCTESLQRLTIKTRLINGIDQLPHSRRL